jgi:hypothetical protein
MLKEIEPGVKMFRNIDQKLSSVRNEDELGAFLLAWRAISGIATSQSSSSEASRIGRVATVS